MPDYLGGLLGILTKLQLATLGIFATHDQQQTTCLFVKYRRENARFPISSVYVWHLNSTYVVKHFLGFLFVCFRLHILGISIDNIHNFRLVFFRTAQSYDCWVAQGIERRYFVKISRKLFISTNILFKRVQEFLDNSMRKSSTNQSWKIKKVLHIFINHSEQYSRTVKQ